ncbi:MAG: NAD-dependent epimerase/dehydratase family protein [Candidatus Paceibacteria bacterium]
MSYTIFITGGAGYVGEMLCEQLSKREDVKAIITLDKEPQSEFSKEIPKLTYIQHNMADDGWQEEVAKSNPDVVIHTAWQIRAMYGETAKQWRWNVDGSDNVFSFAFDNPSVRKLIYFSTASSYAACVDNSITHRFTEAEGFREDEYLYAKEKKVTEERLRALYQEKKEEGGHTPQIFVVRPAAITGPRGRYMRIRFGLQSALSGNLDDSFIYRMVTLLTSFVPATKGWVRQFIHEDDVTDIVMKFAFEPFAFDYEVFNITPEGEPVYASDIAKAVGKKVVPIYPWVAQVAFFMFWHLTRGKVPTAPGSWRFYSYPIIMSGAKLATVYDCKYSSKEAFIYTDGRYESWVPKEKQNNRL